MKIDLFNPKTGAQVATVRGHNAIDVLPDAPRDANIAWSVQSHEPWTLGRISDGGNHLEPARKVKPDSPEWFALAAVSMRRFGWHAVLDLGD